MFELQIHKYKCTNTQTQFDQVFEVEDLTELKNIPKVCKAVARLCRLVRFNFDFFLLILTSKQNPFLICNFKAAADSKNEDLRSVARGIPAFC